MANQEFDFWSKAQTVEFYRAQDADWANKLMLA
jgi:hypothetical protein